MRVLLICPSYTSGAETGFFPLGLASIAAFAKKAGHEVHCLNFNHHPRDERLPLLEREMDRIKPELVATGGLSVIMDSVKSILSAAREFDPKVKTLVGGGGLTADPELIIRHVQADFGVTGEGEESFTELLSVLDGGQRPLSQVKGIAYWRDGAPLFTPERPAIPVLDAIPDPDMEGFGVERHIALQREAPHIFNYHITINDCGPSLGIAASRSCPYRCTFCFHPAGTQYRKRSVSRVVSEMFSLRERFGVGHFIIYDELFDYNPERVREFCHALIQRKARLLWTCQLRVNKVTRELLELMREAGCVLIGYGFESGSDLVLHSMKKRITTTQIARAVEYTRQAKIGIQANFLYGDPAETEETIQATRRFKQENDLDFVDWSAVIPYPGTPLFHDCVHKGLITDPMAFTRQVAQGDTWLWTRPQPGLNMTALPDDVFRQRYLELREEGDLSHLRRTALLRRCVIETPSLFHMTHFCRSCQQERILVIAYPLESSPDTPDPWMPFFGVRGVNALCTHCRRKVNFPPWSFPGMREAYGRFQQRIEEWVKQEASLAVMPAMDRYWALFSQKIDLSRCRVRQVFDDRPFRVGQRFFEQEVRSWEEISAKTLAGLKVVLLPSWNPSAWRQRLEALPIAPENLLRWPDCYHPPVAGMEWSPDEATTPEQTPREARSARISPAR